MANRGSHRFNIRRTLRLILALFLVFAPAEEGVATVVSAPADAVKQVGGQL